MKVIFEGEICLFFGNLCADISSCVCMCEYLQLLGLFALLIFVILLLNVVNLTLLMVNIKNFCFWV